MPKAGFGRLNNQINLYKSIKTFVKSDDRYIGFFRINAANNSERDDLLSKLLIFIQGCHNDIYE